MKLGGYSNGYKFAVLLTFPLCDVRDGSLMAHSGLTAFTQIPTERTLFVLWLFYVSIYDGWRCIESYCFLLSYVTCYYIHKFIIIILLIYCRCYIFLVGVHFEHASCHQSLFIGHWYTADDRKGAMKRAKYWQYRNARELGLSKWWRKNSFKRLNVNNSVYGSSEGLTKVVMTRGRKVV
jgi:hypothetical protein